MRLSKLKLAGFKSFVDPTTVHLPANLTGVVGPNGCGKSNVIDAVRWVMGEISAKHLRGNDMTDVIFSGAAGRKPVGTASVELVFDNSDGALAGPYAAYAEVSLKRQVSRDGQSTYFINGSKCRRKDITQLFLGTGLGSRSYAIIEQGMISRLIEAKPDDLRAFLEEAAGISKYKERRKETESRIAHTRENLDRLNDIREELDKQLKHLQRQAVTARRYQGLKEEERKRIAQDLHDSVGQSLTAIKYSLENAQVLMERERSAEAARLLETGARRVREVLVDVRNISMNLRPAVLDDLGAASAVRYLCREWNDVYTGVSMTTHIAVDDAQIPDTLGTDVFRSVQELLNNVARHAHAAKVRVELALRGDQLSVLVTDDGDGFD